MRYLKWVFGLLPSSLALGQDIPPLSWLGFGDVRGHFEACGCNPRTDLGGVTRLATLVARERAEHPQLTLLSLGNLYGFDSQDKTAALYLGKAMEALKPDAVLVNRSELHDLEISRALKVPFVLSNPSASFKQVFFVKMIRKGGWSIFGYTAASGNEGLEGLSPKLLAAWRALAPKPPRVLLFSGADADLLMLAQSGMFQKIIASNSAPDSARPSFEEHEAPERLKRMGGASGDIWMVPLGGTGVLRGGRLRENQARSLSDMLSVAGGSFKGRSINTLPLQSRPAKFDVSWLDSSMDVGSPLKSLKAEYNAAMAAQFRATSAKRLAGLSQTPFAGAHACKGCHPGAYEVWEKSSHSKAMETLIGVGKAEDPACVACHVVGASDPGGFVSMAESPHLAGVGCENCHGPRKEHAAQPVPSQDQAGDRLRARQTCVSCHHPPHTAVFDANTFWSKIAHGLTVQ